MDSAKIDSSDVEVKVRVGNFQPVTIHTAKVFETGVDTKIFKGTLPEIVADDLIHKASGKDNTTIEAYFGEHIFSGTASAKLVKPAEVKQEEEWPPIPIEPSIEQTPLIDASGTWEGIHDFVVTFYNYPKPAECKFSGKAIMRINQIGNEVTGTLEKNGEPILLSGDPTVCRPWDKGGLGFGTINAKIFGSSLTGSLNNADLKGSFTSSLFFGEVALSSYNTVKDSKIKLNKLGFTPEIAPVDEDGDGTPDSQDECRIEPGPVYNKGCPVPEPIKEPEPVVEPPTESDKQESREPETLVSLLDKGPICTELERFLYVSTGIEEIPIFCNTGIYLPSGELVKFKLADNFLAKLGIEHSKSKIKSTSIVAKAENAIKIYSFFKDVKKLDVKKEVLKELEARQVSIVDGKGAILYGTIEFEISCPTGDCKIWRFDKAQGVITAEEIEQKIIGSVLHATSTKNSVFLIAYYSTDESILSLVPTPKEDNSYNDEQYDSLDEFKGDRPDADQSPVYEDEYDYDFYDYEDPETIEYGLHDLGNYNISMKIPKHWNVWSLIDKSDTPVRTFYSFWYHTWMNWMAVGIYHDVGQEIDLQNFDEITEFIEEYERWWCEDTKTNPRYLDDPDEDGWMTCLDIMDFRFRNVTVDGIDSVQVTYKFVERFKFEGYDEYENSTWERVMYLVPYQDDLIILGGETLTQNIGAQESIFIDSFRSFKILDKERPVFLETNTQNIVQVPSDRPLKPTQEITEMQLDESVIEIPQPVADDTISLALHNTELQLKRHESVLLTLGGVIEDYMRGARILMSITDPNGVTTVQKIVATKDGKYENYLFFDKRTLYGEYQIQTQYLDKLSQAVSFNLLPPFKERSVIAQETEKPREKVPEWVKENVRWWSEGAIGDDSFKQGISHMIKQDIIAIDDLPEKSAISEEKIPDWVKNNAKWWADGVIEEADFVNGIKYMVEKGIISVE